MVDIVEKSQRHMHTRQESFNIRPKGRRKRRKDGNGELKMKILVIILSWFITR